MVIHNKVGIYLYIYYSIEIERLRTNIFEYFKTRNHLIHFFSNRNQNFDVEIFFSSNYLKLFYPLSHITILSNKLVIVNNNK